MEFLTLQSLDSALKKTTAATKHWLYKTQSIPLAQAQNRILATPITSTENLPPFRRSAVDGYALQATDIAGAGESSPAFLTLAGTVLIGQETHLTCAPGQCIEIATGAMLPHNTDTVAMVEYTEVFGTEIAISRPFAPYENIIDIGDDIKTGETLLPQGTPLTPKELGALAALGITQVPVYTQPTMVVISTGDELAPLDTTPPMGKIRDISSISLTAMATGYGFNVVQSILLYDDMHLLESTIQTAMAKADVVVISGGSSYGKYDITADAIAKHANIFTHGIALKPGKPTILASTQNKLVIGLPGHPVSAMVVFELLLGHLSPAPKKPPIPATLTCNTPAAGGKTTIYPCTLHWENNMYNATPILGKSGTITTLTHAQGYFTIKEGTEGLLKGATVLVEMLG